MSPEQMLEKIRQLQKENEYLNRQRPDNQVFGSQAKTRCFSHRAMPASLLRVGKKGSSGL